MRPPQTPALVAIPSQMQTLPDPPADRGGGSRARRTIAPRPPGELFVPPSNAGDNGNNRRRRCPFECCRKIFTKLNKHNKTHYYNKCPVCPPDLKRFKFLKTDAHLAHPHPELSEAAAHALRTNGICEYCRGWFGTGEFNQHVEACSETYRRKLSLEEVFASDSDLHSSSDLESSSDPELSSDLELVSDADV